jgi:hypothetical protein
MRTDAFDHGLGIVAQGRRVVAREIRRDHVMAPLA